MLYFIALIFHVLLSQQVDNAILFAVKPKKKQNTISGYYYGFEALHASNKPIPHTNSSTIYFSN